MAVSNKRHVANFLQERRRAMDGCRFKPENFYEISRVLGSSYAPDLNKVVSNHRADAASAYMRRLQRDVERSQCGYYDQLQALPLQIKRLEVHKEDPRCYKSVLIPKLKLSELNSNDSTPSPRRARRSTKSTSSHKAESLDEVPPLVIKDGSNYVPHKSFNPHSHTHIHVLFKQMPNQKKATSSVISSEVSGTTSNYSYGTAPTDSRSYKSKQHNLKTHSNKLLSHKEEEEEEYRSPRHESDEDNFWEPPVWPNEDIPLPYATSKFCASHAPLPYIMKRLIAEKSPRNSDKSPRNSDKSPRNMDKTPRTERHFNAGSTASESSLVNQFSSREVMKDRLPPNVAMALASGNHLSALHKLDLPHELVAAYNKNLPTTSLGEREKGVGLANKVSRLPLPSIPSKANVNNEMLAITSVQHSSTIQVAS